MWPQETANYPTRKHGFIFGASIAELAHKRFLLPRTVSQEIGLPPIPAHQAGSQSSFPNQRIFTQFTRSDIVSLGPNIQTQ